MALVAEVTASSLRQIAPWCPRLGNPEYPIDHSSMVVARAARFTCALLRQEGLKLFPLLIGQFMSWTALALLFFLLAHPSGSSLLATRVTSSLRLTAPLLEWSGCHDSFNQPRRHVIDKPRNSPLARPRVRLERSDIDGNRSPGIGDRFGLQFRLVNSKVVGQQVGVPCKAGDPAVGVLNNDEVPFAGSRSLNLGDCLEHGDRLQRRRSDPTTNVAYHESIPEFEAQYVSGIGTRIDTADDDRLRCRKEGHIRGEPMRGEVVVARLQGVKSDHGVPPVLILVRGMVASQACCATCSAGTGELLIQTPDDVS